MRLRLRRGVTAEVSRAAPAAGAKDVVLFADLSNRTSNALYQRLDYRTLADWAAYALLCGHRRPAKN